MERKGRRIRIAVQAALVVDECGGDEESSPVEGEIVDHVDKVLGFVSCSVVRFELSCEESEHRVGLSESLVADLDVRDGSDRAANEQRIINIGTRGRKLRRKMYLTAARSVRVFPLTSSNENLTSCNENWSWIRGKGDSPTYVELDTCVLEEESEHLSTSLGSEVVVVCAKCRSARANNFDFARAGKRTERGDSSDGGIGS